MSSTCTTDDDDGQRGDRTYDPVRIKALQKARAARAKRDAAHKELRRTQEQQDDTFLSRRRLDDEGEAAAGDDDAKSSERSQNRKEWIRNRAKRNAKKRSKELRRVLNDTAGGTD